MKDNKKESLDDEMWFEGFNKIQEIGPGDDGDYFFEFISDFFTFLSKNIITIILFPFYKSKYSYNEIIKLRSTRKLAFALKIILILITIFIIYRLVRKIISFF